MTKPYFTRKNLILIALTFFYSLLVVFTGACIDGAHSIFSRKNMINLIGQTLGFDSIAAGTAGFVSLILVGIYFVVFMALVLFERRYAIVNKKKTYSFKMIMLLIMLEEEFEIQFDETDLDPKKIVRVQDVISLVYKYWQ